MFCLLRRQYLECKYLFAYTYIRAQKIEEHTYSEGKIEHLYVFGIREQRDYRRYNGHCEHYKRKRVRVKLKFCKSFRGIYHMIAYKKRACKEEYPFDSGKTCGGLHKQRQLHSEYADILYKEKHYRKKCTKYHLYAKRCVFPFIRIKNGFILFKGRIIFRNFCFRRFFFRIGFVIYYLRGGSFSVNGFVDCVICGIIENIFGSVFFVRIALLIDTERFHHSRIGHHSVGFGFVLLFLCRFKCRKQTCVIYMIFQNFFRRRRIFVKYRLFRYIGNIRHIILIRIFGHLFCDIRYCRSIGLFRIIILFVKVFIFVLFAAMSKHFQTCKNRFFRFFFLFLYNRFLFKCFRFFGNLYFIFLCNSESFRKLCFGSKRSTRFLLKVDNMFMDFLVIGIIYVDIYIGRCKIIVKQIFEFFVGKRSHIYLSIRAERYGITDILGAFFKITDIHFGICLFKFFHYNVLLSLLAEFLKKFI